MRWKVTAFALFASSLVSPTLFAAEGDQRQVKLFRMTDRLLQLSPITIDDVEKITERTLHRSSITSFESDAKIQDKFIRQVEADINPRISTSTATGASISVAKTLVIGKDQIVTRFGKWTKKSKKETYDDDSLKRFGYRSLIWYEYKRKNGGWLGFAFDDDQAKQLRIVQVTNP